MIRIKVTHGANPATYHFWGGFGPVRDSPSGWGTVTESFVPIVTMDETAWALFSNTVNGWWTADLTNIASAVNG